MLVFLNLDKAIPPPLTTFTLLLSIIMTISSTLLALVLMPLCLWIYSRAWINTPVVDLMPFGAIILTLCSTLIPIGLGVLLRYRHTRVADIVLKVILRIFCSCFVLPTHVTCASDFPRRSVSRLASAFAQNRTAYFRSCHLIMMAVTSEAQCQEALLPPFLIKAS